MEKKTRSPKTWRESVGPFLKISGLSRRIQEQKLLDSWDRAVGDAIAEKARPIRVKNRVLQVKVSNSVWMQQLQFMKGLMIQKLHEYTGNDFLQDLRFYVGEIDPLEGKKEEMAAHGQSAALSDTERKRIEKDLAAIRDPEMQEIMRRVYSKALAARKKR